MEAATPLFDTVIPEKCFSNECPIALAKARVYLKEELSGVSEADRLETLVQWAGFISKCQAGPEVVGSCGTEVKECRHPDGKQGVVKWQPELDPMRPEVPANIKHILGNQACEASLKMATEEQTL